MRVRGGGHLDTRVSGVKWRTRDTGPGQGVTHMLSVSHQYNIRVR